MRKENVNGKLIWRGKRSARKGSRNSSRGARKRPKGGKSRSLSATRTVDCRRNAVLDGTIATTDATIGTEGTFVEDRGTALLLWLLPAEGRGTVHRHAVARQKGARVLPILVGGGRALARIRPLVAVARRAGRGRGPLLVGGRLRPDALHLRVITTTAPPTTKRRPLSVDVRTRTTTMTTAGDLAGTGVLAAYPGRGRGPGRARGAEAGAEAGRGTTGTAVGAGVEAGASVAARLVVAVRLLPRNPGLVPAPAPAPNPFGVLQGLLRHLRNANARDHPKRTQWFPQSVRDRPWSVQEAGASLEPPNANVAGARAVLGREASRAMMEGGRGSGARARLRRVRGRAVRAAREARWIRKSSSFLNGLLLDVARKMNSVVLLECCLWELPESLFVRFHLWPIHWIVAGFE